MGDYDAQRDDGFRAIGRYVVAFSEMVSEMRQQIAWHCGGDGYASEKMIATEIALGEAAATNIAHAFFGLARRAADFTDAEEKVANRLAKQVEDVIQARNDVAHGDWQTGLFQHRAGGSVEAGQRLLRIQPHRKAGPFKGLFLTAADIDAMTDQILRLLTTLVEFGKLAFSLPITKTDSQDGKSEVSKGEYRVGDVFTLKGGKGQKKAEVVRDGPKASEVFTLPYI